MDIHEALQPLLPQMEVIKEQIDGLLADASLPEKQRGFMNIMRDNAERFIETIQQFISPDFQLSENWMLSAISHQLKGSLSSVYGFVELLLTDTFGKLSNDHRQIVVFINKRMDTIMSELQRLVNEMRGGDI